MCSQGDTGIPDILTGTVFPHMRPDPDGLVGFASTVPLSVCCRG